MTASAEIPQVDALHRAGYAGPRGPAAGDQGWPSATTAES